MNQALKQSTSSMEKNAAGMCEVNKNCFCSFLDPRPLVGKGPVRSLT